MEAIANDSFPIFCYHDTTKKIILHNILCCKNRPKLLIIYIYIFKLTLCNVASTKKEFKLAKMMLKESCSWIAPNISAGDFDFTTKEVLPYQVWFEFLEIWQQFRQFVCCCIIHYKKQWLINITVLIHKFTNIDVHKIVYIPEKPRANKQPEENPRTFQTTSNKSIQINMRARSSSFNYVSVIRNI